MVRLIIKKQEEEPETIWYLAYGSNMDPKILTGWRKIQPIESKLVVVPGYWLSFDFNGVPFVEPCFASVLKQDPSRMHDRNYALSVHNRCCYGQKFNWRPDRLELSYPPKLQGVAHRITMSEWKQIVQTEGGWGYNIPTCYKKITVECWVVNSLERLPAQVLVAGPATIKSRCQPSLRYKDILVAGAAHHGLDQVYQDYLARIIPYQCSGTRSKLAKLVFMIFNFPMIIAWRLVLRVNRGRPADKHIPPPFWLAWYFDKASRFSNKTHDLFIAPIFGSGRCCTREQLAIVRKSIEAGIAAKKAQEPLPASPEKNNEEVDASVL
ncbi:hypothetical protein BGZ76_001950 [Entomortierella beljakovae]|nr:hypothetical protein BGZ76_001950 [Entomortierella beljakovae]